jgi:phosphoribosyl 1,2-cyclic phosphodiesterase
VTGLSTGGLSARRSETQRGSENIDICVLASGSDGNATFVATDSTAFLIDCGLSCREVCRRLEAIGVEPVRLDALVLTHEHSDHVSGVVPLSRRLGLPVYANARTARKARLGYTVSRLQHFATGETFTIGDLELTTFLVPHDASEPVGLTISDRRVRVGFATDLGSATLEVIVGLSGCNALVLESNHDRTMLIEGPYPWPLKRRVDGPSGHLSNEDAAALVESVLHEGLTHLVLAHVSRINNEPELPLAVTSAALGTSAGRVEVSVGRHDRVGEVIRL